MDGVDIDMLFSQLQIDVIDADSFNILDNRILKNLDEKSVLSINGKSITKFFNICNINFLM